MLTLVATRGRPPKFDEPLITRHFDLPESLNDALVKAGRTKAQADIVRDAIGEYLGESQKKDELAAQVKALLSQERDDKICIELGEEGRTELTRLGAMLGFMEPSHFVFSLAAVSLGKSVDELREFLAGPELREIEQKSKRKAA